MTDSELTGNNAASVAPVRRKRRLRRYAAIGVVALAIIALLGILVLRRVVKSQITPEQQAAMERIESEFVSLPEEWHQPAKLPDADVVEFHNRFDQQVSAILDDHQQLILGWGTDDDTTTKSLFGRMGFDLPPLDVDQQTSYSLLLRDLEPLIAETSSTVAQPDYTMEIDMFGRVNFLNFQSFAKLMRVKAAVDASNGKCMEAMHTLVLPLRMTKRPAQSSAIKHMITVAVATISVHGIYNVSEQCSDTLALRQGLQFLNDNRDVVFPGDILHWRYADTLGSLGFAAANGYPADLRPQPLYNIYAQAAPLYNGYYYQWLIDNLPASDPRVVTAKASLYELKHPIDWENHKWVTEDGALQEPQRQPEVEIDASGTTMTPVWKKALTKLVMGVNPLTVLYAASTLSMDETETRFSVGQATYDLTRLTMAKRLLELEAGPAVPDVPLQPDNLRQYLGTVPIDPFTSSSFSYSANVGYYSTGPDKNAKDAETPYDVTNGTISSGDIVMRQYLR